MNRREAARLLEAEYATVRALSLFDFHIHGTHSLVLKDTDELMLRLYVTPPGSADPAHADWSLPFLYHSHRYDFISGPLIGRVWNKRVSVEDVDADADGSVIWNKYTFDSPIFNKEAAISKIGRVCVRETGFDDLRAGELYQMDASEIHRVGFIPDRRTAWSVVQFYELADRQPSPYCYCEHDLPDLSAFGSLYNRPSDAELRKLVDALIVELQRDP